MALTHRQIDAGLMPPSDLIAAESTLAQRKLQVLQAEAAIDQAYDVLRSALNLPREQWSRPILPVEPPQFVAGIDLRRRGARRRDQASARARAARSRSADRAARGAPGREQSAAAARPRHLGRADRPARQLRLDARRRRQRGLARATACSSTSCGRRCSARPRRRPRSRRSNIRWRSCGATSRSRTSGSRSVTRFAIRRAHRARCSRRRSSGSSRRRASRSSSASSCRISRRTSSSRSTRTSSQRPNYAELTAVLVHKKATAALLKATGMLLDQRHIALDVNKSAR